MFHLLIFCICQVGYMSKSSEDALDEVDVNPGLYAIRFYFTPKEYKTFKYPSNDVSDDLQKGTLLRVLMNINLVKCSFYPSDKQFLKSHKARNLSQLAHPSSSNSFQRATFPFTFSFPFTLSKPPRFFHGYNSITLH